MPLVAICLILAACGTPSEATKQASDKEVSEQQKRAQKVSRENTEDVKYPVIAKCAQEHMNLDWQGEESFRDYVVSVDYSQLPFVVEIDPETDVEVEDFQFCVLEAIRTGGLPMKIPSLLPTGFRVYREDGSRSTIPIVQGITPDEFRQAFKPGIGREPNPHKRLNNCMARHVRTRISGAVMIGGVIQDRGFRDVEIIGSTLDLEKAQDCMVRELTRAEIDLDGGPYPFRFPMAFRSL